MNFKELLELDLAVIFNIDEFAEEVIYIAQSVQQQYNIAVVFSLLSDPDISENRKAKYAEIQLKTSSIPEPCNQDVVWRNNEKWRVERLLESTTYISKLLIRREESAVL